MFIPPLINAKNTDLVIFALLIGGAGFGNRHACPDARCECSTVAKGGVSPLPLVDRVLDEYWFFAERWMPPRERGAVNAFCELVPSTADGQPLSIASRMRV